MKDSVNSAGRARSNQCASNTESANAAEDAVLSAKGAKAVPRVSIGLPVFNGELFLVETLESLVNQTFSDFELIVSDNGSTDRTEEICRSYSARDPRIRYYRNDVNRGAAWNQNRVFELSVAEYFKWNMADDICAPEFLARCVEALDQNPNAAVAMTQAIEIDERGNTLPSVSIPGKTLLPIVPPAAPAHVRFRQNVRLDHKCLTIVGLIRSDILRRTHLFGNYPEADRVLLAHLALLGPAVIVPDTLFFNRDHADRFSRNNRTYYGSLARALWWDPANANRKIFPAWKVLSELRRVVRQTPLGWQERLYCTREIARWLGRDDNMRHLYIDATYYPRKWAVRRFPKVKLAWNRMCSRSDHAEQVANHQPVEQVGTETAPTDSKL